MDIVHHTVLLTPEAVALMNGASPWRRKLLVAIAIVTSMSRYVGAQSLPAEALTAASRPPASIVSEAGRGGLRGATPMARSIVPSTRGAIPRLRLPITTRPTGLATIEGQTVSVANSATPNMSVRLRDARSGKIVGSTVTDDAGKFVFGELDPGSYIAELLDQSQQQVLAASQLVSANADQIATVSVKMPSKLSLLARAIGPMSPASTAVSSQIVGSVATSVFQPPVSER